MSEVKVDLEVLCSCGAELDVKQSKHAGSIEVTPCEKCSDDTWQEGFEKGKKEARRLQ